MPTIRTITASLLLGMLLLPPHWCCAFPAKATAGEADATQLRACCTIQRTVSTATTGSPAESIPRPTRSCCAARSAAVAMQSTVLQQSDTNDQCVAETPADTNQPQHCPFCSPQLTAVQKSATLPLADAWLSTTSDLLPPVSLARAGTFVRYGATLPISGDTLALHCRWNC